MSRKATITQKEIVNAAFKITKKEGYEAITSRKLAAAAGCSTQPIFRIYDNMDGLKEDVFKKASLFYEDYYASYPKNNETPFVDLGMAYIEFAQKYPNLFRLLFLSGSKDEEKSMYALVNGEKEYVVKEVDRARTQGVKEPEQLFMKMWIFIHGSGCMAVTGDYDLNHDDSIGLLEAAYQSFK
ncbi:MAG: TetR/AcrR family transcriptional regulator [Butyrivibrio sp.]|uniref:TetR/AcrR family transcriptional regulator n=1 Tax=Butyrivibrio sp. TaxID=28121 RepID=UPI0025E0AF3C|nr:TetR/AcrR family transcriptional regulator [Butyrivibrio sp.]MCR5772649.1 TetR/AcrR family transcriptional regulator [Butyrivibrio sp.]